MFDALNDSTAIDKRIEMTILEDVLELLKF